MKNILMLKARDFFIKNILILLLFPLIAFFLIFVSYGNELHQYLSIHPEMCCLYELSTIHKIVSQSDIPTHITDLAVCMIIYSYLLFSFWLFLFAYFSYKSLQLGKQNLPLILIEFFVLVFAYYFIINPGLPVYIQILGWLLFLLFAIVITTYFLYHKRIRHEKK